MITAILVVYMLVWKELGIRQESGSVLGEFYELDVTVYNFDIMQIYVYFGAFVWNEINAYSRVRNLACLIGTTLLLLFFL
jgi:hypothetical protein